MFNRESDWHGKVLTYDKSGYYLYLPAVFIYHDLGQLSFYHNIDSIYKPSGDRVWYSIYDQPNHKRINKYPVGVSCMELPFFILTHSWCKWTNYPAADGYSKPYEWGVISAVIFWTIVGLLFIRASLMRYYSDTTVLITLICIALGTNLYHYTFFDMGMSHPFSFALFSALLFFTAKWYDNYKLRDACVLGLLAGFIFITRPTNLLVIIIPIFWEVNSKHLLKERFAKLWRRKLQILLALVVFSFVIIVQLGYWKYVTGHWWFYSYIGERFNFAEPHILDGLFGFRKGWFVYTPLAFVAFAGFYYLYKDGNKTLPVFFIYFLINFYITFSWAAWWYGGGFSCRPLIETYAILALPLAALVHRIVTRVKLGVRIVAIVCGTFFISLNMFQSYQMAIGILHWERMTADAYFYIFGRMKYTEDIQNHLIPE